MRRTLLLIPHEIAGLPVFGLGWMLILLGVLLAIRLVVARRRGEPLGPLLAGEGIIWGLAAAAVVFVLPTVELTNVDGQPVGTAIRGYGVMLLAGVGSAVALAAYRAKRRGLDPDIIYSMAPWAFVGGIVGARVFFVVQYWDKFVGPTAAATIGNVLKITEGGLVVYGAFIGGFLTSVFFVIRHRLSVLKLGDVIVPCLFLGLFFGRIGCLLNGCCYGGRCEDDWTAIHFPPNSPVYEDQIRSGELLGFSYDPETRTLTSVRPGSLADRAGIQVGATLHELGDDLSTLHNASPADPREEARSGVIATIDGKRYRWSPSELPSEALPVRAAQLIASIGGLAVCGLLCSLSLLRLREGAVMMIGFATYAVLRFLLELIRVDESGQFGTELSISQWVSCVVLLLSLAGLWWIYRTPSSASLQPQASSGG